jgi:hypothetical protein
VEEHDSTDDRSHARAIPPVPATVAERVAYIADLMERLEWNRGLAKVIGASWDLAESTIQNYSAEASRLVCADADDARRDITAGCRELFKKAVRCNDPKGAKAVGELWADVAGAKAPEKHQIGALGEMTPAKAREVMSELFPATKPKPEQE